MYNSFKLWKYFKLIFLCMLNFSLMRLCTKACIWDAKYEVEENMSNITNKWRIGCMKELNSNIYRTYIMISPSHL